MTRTRTNPRGAGLGFRTVLCPIDFSSCSLAALRYADAVVRRAKGRLLVLYVNDPLIIAAAGAAFHNRSLAMTSRRELRTFAEEALGPGARSRATRLYVATGDPADEILKLAAKANVDLIVVGTHGLTGAERLLAGSTTLSLLQRTSRPILAVPWRNGASSTRVPAGWPGRWIVAAVDLEARPSHLVQAAAETAQWLGASLRLFSVVAEVSAPAWLTRDLVAHDRIRISRAQRALTRLAAAARRRVDTDSQVVCGTAADELAATIAGTSTGLVVTELSDRRSWLGAKRGSISYHVLSHGVVPVLAVPPHWRPRR